MTSRSVSAAGRSGFLTVCAVTPLLRRWVIGMSVPAGEPDRSTCPDCGASITLAGRIRALSPAARCAGCAAPVGAPPGTVELALLAVAGVLILADRPPAELPALIWWALCAVPLVFIDLAAHRLPDRLTWPAALGTWALLGLAALIGADGADGGRWLRAMAAAGAVAGFLALTTLLLGRRGFGLGDAKLALSVAALLGWLGWPMVLLGLTAALGSAGLVSLALLATRRIGWAGHLPFGPFLVLAVLVALPLAP